MKYAYGTSRMVAGYNGPLMRVRLHDGREFDVYPDDVQPPQGAVRRCDLAELSGGRDVTLTRWPYNQAGSP